MKRFVIIALVATVIGVLILVLSGGFGSSLAEASPDGAQAVYLCRESNELVVAAVQPTPAVNPATGRATLYRALYCRQCANWRAVAPTAAGGGNPLSNVCPRHRQPMSSDGPLPGGDFRSAGPR